MIDAQGVAQLLEQTKQPESRPGAVRLRPSRVLLVDDGESNRELIALLLRRAGVEVHEAANGAEALQQVEEHAFDLVLMDMQMPVMDGYTATEQLRQLGHSMPIVALTANAMQGDEDRCRAAGCSHFLTKPINIDRLLELLAETLGVADEASCDVESGAGDTVRPAADDCCGDPREPSLRRPSDASPHRFVVPSLPLDDPEMRRIAETIRGHTSRAFAGYVGGLRSP